VLSEEVSGGFRRLIFAPLDCARSRNRTVVFFGRFSCETWSQARSCLLGQCSCEGCQLGVSDLLFTASHLAMQEVKFIQSSEMLSTTQRLLVIQDYIKSMLRD
jgi:hypothetical protein